MMRAPGGSYRDGKNNQSSVFLNPVVVMRANPMPVAQREMRKLDEDLDNCRASMKDLQAYAQDWDPQMVPILVAQISQAIDSSAIFGGGDAILLFEQLARVHGRKIVPNIDKIMSSIMKALSSREEHCSIVVTAIARYAIDPLAPEIEKRGIIQFLSKPLSDELMSLEGSVSSGAAECLKALVNLDNWKFASREMVNEVCLNVAGALEDALTRSVSHIGLVMALAKRNSWILEAYARSLVRSGLKILSSDIEDNTSQMCFSAIQMIHFLMRCVDLRSISSELESIIQIMEKLQNGQFPFVQAAAFEALQTANIIAPQEGSRNKLPTIGIAGSDLVRVGNVQEDRVSDGRFSLVVEDHDASSNGSSSKLPSHESQSLLYDSFVTSPMSTAKSSCNFQCIGHANKGEWTTDVDSKDGAKKNGFICLRSWPNGDVMKTTPTSRRLILPLHNHSDCTATELGEGECRARHCPCLKYETDMLLNGSDYHSGTYRRANSDNQKVGREQQIQEAELLHDHLVTSSSQAQSKATLKESNCDQTVNMRKINFVKARIGLICSFVMIFVAIVLLGRSISNDEVPLHVVPT